MATMKDVATLAGVSLATVSHVINKSRPVSRELTERVESAMRTLSYHPNRIARSLRTKRTNTIGLVVSDITNPFFSNVARGAEDAAASVGFSVVISNTDEDEAKEEACVQTMLKAQYDGVVFAATGSQSRALVALRNARIPFVLIDRKVSAVDSDVVLSNNESAAFQATTYLLEQGHRTIGVILGNVGVTSSDERFVGFERAFCDFGVSIPSADYVARGSYRIEGGRAACRELLFRSPRPTAIFIVNNRMTIGALEEVIASGLSCPEDISIVGFDDFEGLSLFKPPITTVAQQPYELGREAVGLLLKRIDGQGDSATTERRLNCELIIRESVRSLADRLNPEGSDALGVSKKG
jgi:LacI family transcriptional regulator